MLPVPLTTWDKAFVCERARDYFDLVVLCRPPTFFFDTVDPSPSLPAGTK